MTDTSTHPTPTSTTPAPGEGFSPPVVSPDAPTSQGDGAMIDATPAGELARERIEERQRAAAVADNAARMVWALEAVSDAVGKIAATHNVDSDKLEWAYKMGGGHMQMETETDLALAVENIDKALDTCARIRTGALPITEDVEAAK